MKVAIFGGTGFVGNYIVSELIKNNYSVTALVREGSENKLDDADKCNIVNGDIEDVEVVEQVIKEAETVIYNIGIIREFKSKGITYDKLHFDGAKLVIDLCKKHHVDRFIMMSANGVKSNGTGYQRTKYDADVHLKNNIKNWTIIRPSLVFGDSNGKKEFCSELKKDMLSLPFPAPSFFSGVNIFSAGKFRMSPVHVKDVAKIFVDCIENNHSFKKVYELGGKSFTWNEIISIISSAYNKRKLTVPAPAIVVYMMALLLDRFSWFPISRDQITMLLEGNTCESAQIFKRYNIKPIAFKSENLSYLLNGKK